MLLSASLSLSRRRIGIREEPVDREYNPFTFLPNMTRPCSCQVCSVLYVDLAALGIFLSLTLAADGSAAAADADAAAGELCLFFGARCPGSSG